MKRAAIVLALLPSAAIAQTATNYNYNTVTASTATATNNNNNTSTATSTNTNINQNINSGTVTNVNQNTSTSASTVDATHRNISFDTSVSNVTSSQTVSATNVNRNSSDSTSYTESVSRQIIDQNLKSPPPSAIAPSMMSYSQDLCTTGLSGAVQTQILGISAGKAVRDGNCERLKLSKTLYDMGMRVAAVSLLCQEKRVLDNPLNAKD